MSDIVTDVLKNLHYLVAIIGGDSAGTVYLCQTYRKRSHQIEKRFCNVWTNEGDPTRQKSHYVDLELTVEERKVRSVINSHSLNSETRMPNISIVGTRRGKTVKAELVDLIQGRKVTLGEVELTKDNDRLYWKMLTGDNEAFPEETTLWPDLRHA